MYLESGSPFLPTVHAGSIKYVYSMCGSESPKLKKVEILRSYKKAVRD